MVKLIKNRVHYPFTKSTFNLIEFKNHIDMNKDDFRQFVSDNFKFDMRKFNSLWKSMQSIASEMTIPKKQKKYLIQSMYTNKDRLKFGIITIEENSRTAFIVLSNTSSENKSDIVSILNENFNNVKDITYTHENGNHYGYILIS